MRTNPLKQLETLGQSIWLDYIRRDLMTSGELRRLNVPSARLENEGVEKSNEPFDKLMETLTQISKQNIKRES